MSGKRRVGVLLGGLSAQRELSMRAGEAIVAALAERGVGASSIFVDRDIDLVLRQSRPELAFLALRGRYGGDGCIQGLLETLGIPYTGPGVLAAALTMSKARTKEILRLRNLPTAPGYVLRGPEEGPLAQTHGTFGFPVVVSPVGAGPALGVSIARDEAELELAVDHARRFDEEVLVERFFEGRVVRVGLLEGKPLGALEAPAPRPSTALGDLLLGEKGDALVPVRLSVARYNTLLRVAAQVCEAMDLTGPTLIAFLVSDRANEVVLEVDAAPTLLPQSAFARIAERAGWSFAELVEEVLAGARLSAHGHRRERRGPASAWGGPERRAGVVQSAH
jgi:D-alanine-D-alanine ligase